MNETKALELAKIMVQKQDEIFEAIGVRFPKWDGRSLSLKNMEHCLGQYGKFLQIISDLRYQRSFSGHRLLLESQSALDMKKSCRYCNVQSDQGLFCDSCLCFYCGSCEKDSCENTPTNWICRPCVELSQIKFQD